MSSPTLQDAFFSEMNSPQSFRMMFEFLPGIFFFVKDVESRMIAANSAVLERLGVKSEQEIIGTFDQDYFPEAIAKGFRDDDQIVIRSGKPLTNRMEAWYDELRQLDWFITTKVPVFGQQGNVIGIMGVTVRDEKHVGESSSHEVASIIQYIKQNSNRVLGTQELAAKFCISERSLSRKLHATLGTSPYELILRIRIQKAAEALIKTARTISQIAADHGFCDQSTFTQHFRKRVGLTPNQFRKRHTHDQ
jgi:AraC-like DNA-binding protein